MKRINEFEWTVVKLKDLLDECVQDDSEKLINFTRFLKECEVVTSDEGNMYDRIMATSLG